MQTLIVDKEEKVHEVTVAVVLFVDDFDGLVQQAKATTANGALNFDTVLVIGTSAWHKCTVGVTQHHVFWRSQRVNEWQLVGCVAQNKMAGEHLVQVVYGIKVNQAF